MITKKYYKLIRVSHADEGYFYIKNVSNEVGEFKISSYSSGKMEYSLDGVTWTSYDLKNKPTVNVNPGSNIYLRGTNFKYNNNDNVLSFNKSYNICGNFMSLNNYSTMSSVSEINSSNYIQCVFKNQTNLISAQDLNFGNVNAINYQGLYGVFYGCSSLTTPPDLSSISSVGEQGMYECFSDCSSLTTPPDFSSISSVGVNGMYQCFNGCSSLTTPPDLQSLTTVGINGFNYTFYGSGLLKGMDLTGVTTVGSSSFAGVYSGCRYIYEVTTPNVQDLTQNAILQSWLADSAGSQATGTKTVRVPTGATIATDSDSGIPTGWTRVDY